jgi:hypothetical protein
MVAESAVRDDAQLADTDARYHHRPVADPFPLNDGHVSEPVEASALRTIIGEASRVGVLAPASRDTAERDIARALDELYGPELAARLAVIANDVDHHIERRSVFADQTVEMLRQYRANLSGEASPQ